MKCYALAACFGTAPIKWIIPGSHLAPHYFFAQQTIKKILPDIIGFCEKIDSGSTHYIEKEGYFFCVQKWGTDYCLLATDSELNSKQMLYLSHYLLKQRVDLETVANDLEKYTKDYRVESIIIQASEVTDIMRDNLEIALKRGEQIEELVGKAEKLEAISLGFRHEAKELNSCWPCNIF